jgi:hypothetical protein
MQTKYRIVPERIGRHSDVKPFTVVIDDSDDTDGQRIAEAMHNMVGDYLLSKEYGVFVDLGRGTFDIDRGRFGKGRIEVKEQTDGE